MEDFVRHESLSDLLPELGRSSTDASGAIVHILHAVRDHLGLDVAFVSEFIGDSRTLRHVDAAGRNPIYEGQSIPLDVGYCKRVVEGSLPCLIPDTGAVPLAMMLPETHQIPIGSHLSVPIRLADGRLYGTFCCFGFQPDLSLNARDLMVMKAFADLVAYEIGREVESNTERDEKVARIRAVIESGGPEIVFQPIYRLRDMRAVGLECLSRFPVEYSVGPDAWFADAESVGLGAQLEISAIKNALRALKSVPSNVFMTVNTSPETIMEPEFNALFHNVNANRIVLEITEHAHVEDYAQLRSSLSHLRSLGMRVAVDDAGAGYASLRHILNLQPDIIKLDVSLTRSIDSDGARRALAAALIEFGKQTGSEILAEGVETLAELKLLRGLGAHKAQGFYLCRPLTLEQALAHSQPNGVLAE